MGILFKPHYHLTRLTRPYIVQNCLYYFKCINSNSLTLTLKINALEQTVRKHRVPTLVPCFKMTNYKINV